MPNGSVVSGLQVLTAGLGHATLGRERGKAPTACEKALPDESPLLPVIKELPANGIHLRVRVPTELVRDVGTTVEGKIIITVPFRDPLELPIKVRNVAAAGAAATSWILAIVVPALLTAGLAYFGHMATTAWTARRKEEMDFITFKDQNFEELKRVFTILYPTIYNTDPPDLRTLAEELRSKHLIDHLPRRLRRRLETALARSDLGTTVSVLGDAFSHWRLVLEGKFNGWRQNSRI